MEEHMAQTALPLRSHAGKTNSKQHGMPPPPPPLDTSFDSPATPFDTRSTRSMSTASRNSNRLSLTLPIAAPTGYSSRPIPTTTNPPSYPPTPKDTPIARSPTDANDFIHAIAAQERRVLELREELKDAEADLMQLKSQWGRFDSLRKRNAVMNGEPLRPPLSTISQPNTPRACEDIEAKRRSIELDRRRALLLSQQLNPQSPSTSGRRRVIRGGHTRTLSLLSPTKPEGFSLLDDQPDGLRKESESSFQNCHALGRYPPLTAAQVSKRASWAPRSSSPTSNNGVKKMAGDFKAGLWTFVEDLRQATVGDEPINGGSLHRRASSRSSSRQYDPERDQDTIRASATTALRPRVGNTFSDIPSPPSRYSDSPANDVENATAALPRRSNSKRTKHFSWTPLTVDSYDDNDWSNWDSPAANSPRWSGTTVSGDIIPTIPEKNAENDKNKTHQPTSLTTPGSPSSLKLEELSLSVLNKLTPANLTRVTSEFMTEWEKSLSSPPASDAGYKEKGM